MKSIDQLIPTEPQQPKTLSLAEVRQKIEKALHQYEYSPVRGHMNYFLDRLERIETAHANKSAEGIDPAAIEWEWQERRTNMIARGSFGSGDKAVVRGAFELFHTCLFGMEQQAVERFTRTAGVVA